MCIAESDGLGCGRGRRGRRWETCKSIGETVHVRGRLRVCNNCVTRSMVGAVVGLQPFGGRSPLRHRGPKPAGLVDMRYAWIYVAHMTTTIQIRNVRDALHRQLKSRAALAGMSLSDYLLGKLRRVAERPTLDELRVRLERRPKMTISVEPTQVVRAERDRQ